MKPVKKNLKIITTRTERRGATLVEFAMVAPLLFLLLFGMIEFSRYTAANHAIQEAARCGCRVAILEEATEAEVKAKVNELLTVFGISTHTTTISPSLATASAQGDPITVTVSVTYNEISWVPTPQFLSGKVLSVSSTLPREL